MNSYSIVAVAALLGAGTLSAQAQTNLPARKPVQPRQKAVIKGETMKDGFLMKDGKVLMTRDAHTDALTSETSLVNGTKVKPDGSVIMADGTSAMLKEGDYMSLTGRMTTAAFKAQQDSLLQVAKEGGKGKMKSKKKVK